MEGWGAGKHGEGAEGGSDMGGDKTNRGGRTLSNQLCKSLIR